MGQPFARTGFASGPSIRRAKRRGIWCGVSPWRPPPQTPRFTRGDIFQGAIEARPPRRARVQSLVNGLIPGTSSRRRPGSRRHFSGFRPRCNRGRSWGWKVAPSRRGKAVCRATHKCGRTGRPLPSSRRWSPWCWGPARGPSGPAPGRPVAPGPGLCTRPRPCGEGSLRPALWRAG